MKSKADANIKMKNYNEAVHFLASKLHEEGMSVDEAVDTADVVYKILSHYANHGTIDFMEMSGVVWELPKTFSRYKEADKIAFEYDCMDSMSLKDAIEKMQSLLFE